MNTLLNTWCNLLLSSKVSTQTKALFLLGAIVCITACSSSQEPSATIKKAAEEPVNYLRPGKETALDAYVAKPDDSYSWELVREDKHPGYTEYLIDMDSQTWRDESQVDRTLWQHWLALIVPDKPCSKTAMLLISGGSNGRETPGQAPKNAVRPGS